MHDVAEFLADQPPFDALDAEDLERVARAAEIEFHPARALVFDRDAGPLDHVWVVRSGAIELLDGDRVIDLLGPGEALGYSSLLSGMPPGLTARALEDTLAYRLPDPRALLSDPARLRFRPHPLFGEQAPGAGRVADDPAQRPIGSVMRSPAVVCAPDTPIRAAARRMTEAGQTCAIVDLGQELGIVTDWDLRSCVATGEVPVDAPVTAVMTAPAHSAPEERLASEALLEMLERGVRHLPVVSATGAVVGVVADRDLVAVDVRAPFHMRAAIARAGSVTALATAARELHPTIVALFDARVAPGHVAAMITAVVDALTRRLIELALAELGEPAPFAWLALGSLARREAMPGSDVDSAIVWHGGPESGRDLNGVAVRVIGGLEACGLTADRHGAVASSPRFARSIGGWQAAARGWLADPSEEDASILISVLVDGRPVWGTDDGAPLAKALRGARERPDLLRLLARDALAYRPPTGFVRELVIEHSGAAGRTLDLKRGGLLPIVNLARWAGMAAGVSAAGTAERLRAAGAAGSLSEQEARTLEEAFELVLALRLGHQVEQIRHGETPDDRLDPARLNRLARRYLKDAFRSVAAVQRKIAADVKLGIR